MITLGNNQKFYIKEKQYYAMNQIKIWKEEEIKELNDLVKQKESLADIKKHFYKHSEYDVENKLFVLKLNKKYNPTEKFVNKEFNKEKEIKFFI